jgi:Zn-finger nucleic acid-binding protein
MICPKCRGDLSEFNTSEGVEVDFCSGCKGTLFDAGEVAAYFELATDIPALEQHLAGSSDTNLTCPKCDTGWVELKYTGDSALVVDLCTGCGCVWLDKGEIPKLHQLSAGIGTPQSRLVRTIQSLSAQGYQVLGVETV